MQMEGGGLSGSIATVHESSLTQNNPYKNGHSFRAVRKYDMVNQDRGGAPDQDGAYVDGGVVKQRVPNSNNIELDRQMEANQRRYHYELTPKYLAGNDLRTIMESSKMINGESIKPGDSH